jgi:hypothetical protein
MAVPAAVCGIWETSRMFGWFRPRCPVDLGAKMWIEKRLRWLADQFGVDVFTRRALVLPTAEFFPEPFDRSQRNTRALLDQVCGYMDVTPEQVELEFFTESQLALVNEQGHYLGGTAGTYHRDSHRTTIRIETTQLHTPMALVGTMAHELAHHRLLGEGRLTGEEFDHELLTDLTVVFHGLGIFLANVPRASVSAMSYWPGTGLRRPEYMSLPMFGYALAHAAWHRGELKAAWARYLSWEARTCVKHGLRYLHRTGDSTFRPRQAAPGHNL